MQQPNHYVHHSDFQTVSTNTSYAMILIILQQHDEEVNQNSLEKRTGCNVVKTAAIFIRMEALSVMEIRREEFEAAREDIINHV